MEKTELIHVLNTTNFEELQTMDDIENYVDDYLHIQFYEIQATGLHCKLIDIEEVDNYNVYTCEVYHDAELTYKLGATSYIVEDDDNVYTTGGGVYSQGCKEFYNYKVDKVITL